MITAEQLTFLFLMVRSVSFQWLISTAATPREIALAAASRAAHEHARVLRSALVEAGISVEEES